MDAQGICKQFGPRKSEGLIAPIKQHRKNRKGLFNDEGIEAQEITLPFQVIPTGFPRIQGSKVPQLKLQKRIRNSPLKRADEVDIVNNKPEEPTTTHASMCGHC